MGNLVLDRVEVSDDIFKFLGMDSDVLLSDMTNSDRIYMMYLLKQYYLKLRSRLGISEDITFGVEIEFEDADIELVEENLSDCFSSDKWSVVKEESIIDGGEVNSPILTDKESSWIDLSTVCSIVDENALVDNNTGGHIHIGVHILGDNPRYWANFAKLWMAYENVIYRFLYGEFISPRSEIMVHAAPISKSLIGKIDKINDRARMIISTYIMKLLDAGDDYQQRRKRAVNFTNVSDISPYKYDNVGCKNTIEFRSPNGTFNPVIWQNNINLLVHLFLYAKSDMFNEDIINRRILQIIEDGIPSNLGRYSNIYNNQAIELADLIFDNNLDKVYFLRQYIKDGSVSTKPLVRSKKFTSK